MTKTTSPYARKGKSLKPEKQLLKIFRSCHRFNEAQALFEGSIQCAFILFNVVWCLSRVWTATDVLGEARGLLLGALSKKILSDTRSVKRGPTPIAHPPHTAPFLPPAKPSRSSRGQFIIISFQKNEQRSKHPNTG